MTTIQFQPSKHRLTPEQRERRKETTQAVATGTAATGTAAYTAKRYASKKYLNNMFDTVTKTATAVERNAREATTLWGKFKLNSVKFTKDITARLARFKDSKVLGPIIKSKAMKGVTGAFGVVMASFVLVTGVSDAVKTGKIAINNLRSD